MDLAVERTTTCVLLELLAAGPLAGALEDGGVSALGIAAMGGHAKVRIRSTAGRLSPGRCTSTSSERPRGREGSVGRRGKVRHGGCSN